MVEVSRKTGKRLMIAYCNRFATAARMIKDLIDSRKYGRVISAEFHRNGGSDAALGWNDWFHDFSFSGSATLDLHIHDVDMIRWMFGMPKAVSMVGGNYMTRGGGYDVMATTYAYEDMYVTAHCDWFTAGNKFSGRFIRVNFENGYICVDRTAERKAFVEVPRHGDVIDHAEMNVFDAYYEEIRYFAQCIRDGKALDYNFPDESVDSVRLVMAELESADHGGMQVKL
jgi:predicted dehydrogenase